MTEPTEPRTHHTHAVTAESVYLAHDGDSVPVAVLPDDWEPGTPVVVSTVPPDGLWPGPDGTWLAPADKVPPGWQWTPFLNGGAELRWQRTSPVGHSCIASRWLQCRPVPAPEPATVKVPWWEAVGRTLPDGRKVTEVSREDGFAAWVITGVGKADLRPDDDGMVSVLRDADPTPTSPAAARRLVDVADDDLSELRPEAANEWIPWPCPAICVDCEPPVPSVVPAGSPDTGRWHVDDGDLFPPSGSHWYEAHSPDHDFDEEAACQRLADVLNRRDRPQPTAEQVELHYLRQLLHAVDVGINALMADLPGTTESALAVMRHARDTAQAAVVACRTTEGTGE